VRSGFSFAVIELTSGKAKQDSRYTPEKQKKNNYKQ